VKLSLVPREREYFPLFSEFAATLEQAAQLLTEVAGFAWTAERGS
jgi:hypothetical protein